MTYRIRNWSEHFENNRTRELKELRFVILPNKHDGDGYTELLSHSNGAAHYGAWIAIVQVASKGQHPAGGCGIPAGCCECRGILLREGAKPHDPASLSRITRIPEKVFKETIPRLMEIGWIDEQAEENQADSAIPHLAAVPSTAQSRTPLRKSDGEQNGMEGNGIEKKTTLVEQVRLVFGFWQEHMEHPKSALDEKRGNAIKARIRDGYTVEDLTLAVRGCKLTPHNMGQNDRGEKYDDIELICRDAAHVDRFMGKAGGHVPSADEKKLKQQELERRWHGTKSA